MSRTICTGKIKPDLKQDCNHPIMILKSAPTVRDGKIYQVITFGCFNPDCDRFQQEVDREEHELEQF